MCVCGSSVARSDDWRCGTRLISAGDSTEIVVQACGAPTKIRTSTVRGRKKGGFQYTTHFEVWTYNRGPYEFVRNLTFREGLLEKIEEAYYGEVAR